VPVARSPFLTIRSVLIPYFEVWIGYSNAWVGDWLADLSINYPIQITMASPARDATTSLKLVEKKGSKTVRRRASGRNRFRFRLALVLTPPISRLILFSKAA
jgi:hypothetical protein